MGSKQQFNENSKIPSKWEFFPEINHNEVVGWEEKRKIAKCFSAIILRDKGEPEEIRCRIEATKELMVGKTTGVYEVWSMGEGKLAKMLSTTLIGDFTSIYLAILRGIDPAPVKTINLIKNRIAKAGTLDKIMREFQEIFQSENGDC